MIEFPLLAVPTASVFLLTGSATIGTSRVATDPTPILPGGSERDVSF